MLENMKTSEKVLMGITIVAVLGYVGWKFGLEEMLSNSGTSDSQLVAAKEEFEENREVLGMRPLIERKFVEVEQAPSNDRNIRPELAFQEEVTDISRRHGFTVRSIKADKEEIEGVDDYELINVEMRTEGKFDQTARLLKAFNEVGMMIRELELDTAIDRDLVETQIIVSRITEIQERSSFRRDRRNRF